ncbi:unnamed protein product, partial [Mesorhabditis spiculigera]
MPSLRRKAKSIDSEDEETLPCLRYRPPSIQELCNRTHFSPREIKVLYRSFKQSSPNGVIQYSQFEEIYCQFFPQGDARYYANMIFKTFDTDANGIISFEEFVIGLSIISRGTNEEKLQWIFSLYDFKKKGVISYTELLQTVQSVYCLLGAFTDPPVCNTTISNHVIHLLKKFDPDRNGLITRESFVASCLLDETLCQELQLFDTKL